MQRASDDLRRTEEESAALAQRLLARLVRFFELLVLILIVLFELDRLWHQAGNALAVRPRR